MINKKEGKSQKSGKCKKNGKKNPQIESVAYIY